MIRRRAAVLAFILITLALQACSGLAPTPATATPAIPSATPAPPTATPLPLAATVNGSPVSRAEFEAEVARYEAAQLQAGIELATQESYRDQVLWALIDLELLAQASTEDVDESELDRLIEELSQAQGGPETMASWLAANGYDVASLKRALRREVLAQRTVQQVADSVPAEMEQVRASHILVTDRALAESILVELEDGADFAELAVQNSKDPSSRAGGGELGWFPRGILTQPEVEAAAFELAPGETSPVVETDLGYHVVHVSDRAVREVAPNDLRRLRNAAVETWLEDARETAHIQILIEP